jgi:hypothetical protein
MMNYQRLFSLLLPLIILTSIPLGAKPMIGSGSASIDKKVLKVKSAMAVWNPAANELVVSLFPFVLTSDQIKRLEQNPADYVVADYPEQKRFLRFTLEFNADSGPKFGGKDVRFQAVTLWRMNGNENISAQMSEVEGQLQITGDFRKTKSLKLKAKGERKFREGKHMKWDISTQCRVFIKTQ